MKKQRYRTINSSYNRKQLYEEEARELLRDVQADARAHGYRSPVDRTHGALLDRGAPRRLVARSQRQVHQEELVHKDNGQPTKAIIFFARITGPIMKETPERVLK